MKLTNTFPSVVFSQASRRTAGTVALLILGTSCAPPTPSGPRSMPNGSNTVPITGLVAPRVLPQVAAAATNEAVTGWIDSHVPPDVTWTTNELSYYLSAYQKIKAAFKTASTAGQDAAKDAAKADYVALAIDIISILGLTSGGTSSNVNKILQQVIADIETEYSGLSWEAQTLQWGTMEHDITGPMAVATAYYNMNGNSGQAACPLPDTNGCGISSATGDVAELETDYSVLFGRPYNANAVAGTWQQYLAASRNAVTGTVTTAMSTSKMAGTDWVFDWRVGLTALAQFVSEYTQIYALTDPNYLNDNTWDAGPGGLQDLRTLLETLYTDISKGVHADYMCDWAQQTGSFPVPTYSHSPIYCDGNHWPDLYYGQQVSVSMESPVTGSPVWTGAVAAADIDTGIQAQGNITAGSSCPNGGIAVSHRAVPFWPGQPNTNPWSVDHFIAPSQSCLADMKNNALAVVYSKMPLADLRATIDRLADMQDAPVEINNLPGGTISDCQAVADQYGIMQNSSWGTANTTALQAQWQASGCYARASWLDTAWSLRSSRALDYDGDGRADLAVWRPDNSGWRPLSGQVTGAPSLAASPQLGNGLGMFYRMSTSTWTAWNSISYGFNTDVPIPGYYEGPGRAIMEAVWRPSNGAWYIRDSSGTVRTFNWGSQGNIPLPADYDGDGIDDLTVWDPSSGTWYTFPSGGQGPYNYYNNSYWVQAWGQLGDTPVPADYDGDGIADRAVWRPTEGNWYILGTTGSNPTVQWGQIGDIPVPGNYEALGTDLAVFRPTEGKFYILNHDRTAGWWVGWGQQGDIPVPGDFDGDGKTDVAVFRPSNSTWYWINSTDWSGHSLQYGYTGDVPLP